MDHNFTTKIQLWLQTPEAERDYEQGALFLLQLSSNRIQYNNLIRNIKSLQNRQFIEYQLQKYVNFRVQQLTKAQVEEMNNRVKLISDEHRLAAYDGTNAAELDAPKPSEDGTVSPEEARKGKRTDHENLPDEIKALYVENLNILHRMREVHLRLRLLSTENATCPDSERYPFLKELIDLDKKYHKNWQVYDHFDLTTGEVQLQEDARTISKNALKTIRMMMGRFKSNPSENLQVKILELYKKIINPSDKLIAELNELGLLKDDQPVGE